MAGIDGLIQQAVNDMYAKSSEEIITQASFYLTKITTIQKKIGMLTTSSTLDELANLSGEANATQISINDSKKVAMNKLMLDGYHVLSELGAWIGSRDSTNYTVVVTCANTSMKYSWDEMSFEEFKRQLTPRPKKSKKAILDEVNGYIAQFSNGIKKVGLF